LALYPNTHLDGLLSNTNQDPNPLVDELFFNIVKRTLAQPAQTSPSLAAGLGEYFALPPPYSIIGLSEQLRPILQSKFLTVIRWTAPTGVPWTPAVYLIYRNAGLTDLVGSARANGPLQFVDSNTQRGVTYTYCLVAADTVSVQHFLGSVVVTSS
jgi:hypothetical protein